MIGLIRIKTILYFCIILFSYTSEGQILNDNLAKEYIKIGDHYLLSGNNDSAIICYSIAMKYNTRDCKIFDKRGIAFTKIGK